VGRPPKGRVSGTFYSEEVNGAEILIFSNEIGELAGIFHN
jgi:hypothetical protein